MPVPQSLPCPRFQPPPHRTQHADFPHYALLHTSGQGLCDLSCWGHCRRGREITDPIIAKESESFVDPPSTPSLPAEALALQKRQDVSAFALTYILRLRSCRVMGEFVISPLPSLSTKSICAAGSPRSTGVAPLQRYSPSAAASSRTSKSAAQTPERVQKRAHEFAEWIAYDGLRVLSKNTNELETGAPGRFDRHRPVASPRSGACRRRCRRFEFPVRAGKTPSSNGMPRTRAETWIQARAAPGPERASRLRRGSPGLDSGPLGRPLFRRCTALSATRSPLWRKRGTRKSRLETKTENEASSALLARLW